MILRGRLSELKRCNLSVVLFPRQSWDMATNGARQSKRRVTVNFRSDITPCMANVESPAPTTFVLLWKEEQSTIDCCQTISRMWDCGVDVVPWLLAFYGVV